MKRYISILICISLILTLSIAVSPLVSAESNNEIIRYGKSTIANDDVKYIYEIFELELTKEAPPENIDFSEGGRYISPDELSLAMKLFLSDHPECFYVSSAYSYSILGENIVSITPQYSFTGTALAQARTELEAAVSSIMAGMPSTDNYSKALYLHDRLAERVTYEFVGEHQTVYGALVSGKAVCAGYAAAYQLLLQRAGIVAWKVTGESLNPSTGLMEGHAWNMVMIEDGVCVFTDVTWDDTGDELYHYYFNISKSEIDIDHVTDYTVYTLPDCTHEHHSYFDVSGKVVGDSTTAEELAGMFKLPKNGQREAIVCYNGNDINAFFGRITSTNDLFVALSCGPGEIGIAYSAIGNELHITVTGNFEGVETEPETTANPITEAPTETAIEATTEPVTDPVTEALTENVTEVTAEPVTEASTENVTETTAEPVTEAPTENVTEVTAEPTTEAPTENVTETEAISDKEITETDTSGREEKPTESEKMTDSPDININLSGCKMSTGGAISLFASATAAVIVIKKNKEERKKKKE